MEKLPLHLALHGTAVTIVSVVAGLILWRVLYQGRDGADWHLVHASGTGRGVFLLALAPVISLAELPEWLAAAVAWQIIFFVWTSLFAMNHPGPERRAGLLRGQLYVVTAQYDGETPHEP